jgi:thiamine biosynthesis lipoprotein
MNGAPAALAGSVPEAGSAADPRSARLDDRALVSEVVHDFEGRAMASPLRLTAVAAGGDEGRAIAEQAWSAVVDEFAASEDALSRFREDSDVTALCRAALRGEAMAVGRRLAIAAHACDRAHRLTDGRFDPRVIGQLDAWGYRGATLGQPVSTAAAGAPDRIMERADRRRIRLAHPIDLGGIGKGLAVRWAAARIRQTGVSSFLLDAGGDIATSGPAPERGPWQIGVEDPGGSPTPLAVIALEDGAIATSSIRRLQWVVDGRPRHHLVDPATGEPADGGLIAVTVAAADPAWAEVWSKSLFIAGRARIAQVARARGLAAWWVTQNGALEMTPAARLRTIWVAGEA